MQGLDFNGKPREQTVLVIELKDNGLNFEWDSFATGRDIDIEIRGQLNRILLAKLKVEIEGIGTKEIALHTPTIYNKNKFESSKDKDKDKDNSFTLWKPDGKEFAVYETDNILLDFAEWFNGTKNISVPEPKKFQQIPYSLWYVPYVNDENIRSVMLRKKDLKVKIDFNTNSLERLEEQKKENEQELSKLKKQMPNDPRQIVRKLNKDLPEKLAKLMQEYNKTIYPNVKNDLGNQIASINTQLSKLREQFEKIKELEPKIDDCKTKKKSIESKIEKERAKWKDVRIETFSIYLLKHDTKPEDVDKPENRLLLFDVKP